MHTNKMMQELLDGVNLTVPKTIDCGSVPGFDYNINYVGKNPELVKEGKNVSTFVCGIVYGQFETVQDMIDFSFFLSRSAEETRIGLNLGGNVAQQVSRRYANEVPAGILLELTDSPLDNTAEALFAPDGVCVEDSDEIIRHESLKTRMERVQRLFENLFAFEQVENVLLEIDYAMGEGSEEQEMQTNLSNFSASLVQLYEKEQGEIPYVKIEITR